MARVELLVLSALALLGCGAEDERPRLTHADAGPDVDVDANYEAKAPYACGWAHGDPGNLESTGAEEGDVIENVPLVDQCGETVPLWDFAGQYRMLFMTTVW
ncbi:MAG: hypothetical protein KF718_31595 [Polyangiaceae bacterium]|nr:hypothetical protein [Polyangiaceae bacterium]